MAPNTPIKIPEWCIIPQGFTIEHRCWKPNPRLWRLIISPLHASLRCLASLLLLCSSLDLVFMHEARPPCLYYILALLLSLSFWIDRLRSDGKDGWGGRTGDLGGGRGSLGWVNFPNTSFPSWDSINSIKPLLAFLWIPISSKVLTSACCLSRSADVLSKDRRRSNTSNSSEESDKSTIPSGLFSSSSSFSFSSSSSWRTGWDEDAPTEGWPQRVVE